MIQWLVFAGILAIVVALAIWGVSISRAKARDAVRVAHVKEIRAGLEMYYNEQGAYPSAPEEGIVLGTGNTRCLDSEGFKASCSGRVYINYIPPAPFPADKDCTSAANQYRYYSSDGAYNLTFCLGRPAGGLSAGLHQAQFNTIR